MDDYISRQAAIDACFDGWNNTADDCARNIKCIPAADVVSKADITALLEETEKELVKGTDEMSVARCFIVSIMGIVKCKIMQMGERKE